MLLTLENYACCCANRRYDTDSSHLTLANRTASFTHLLFNFNVWPSPVLRECQKLSQLQFDTLFAMVVPEFMKLQQQQHLHHDEMLSKNPCLMMKYRDNTINSCRVSILIHIYHACNM